MKKLQYGSIVIIGNNVDKTYEARKNRIGEFGQIVYIETEDNDVYADVQFKYNGSNEDRIFQQVRFKIDELLGVN